VDDAVWDPGRPDSYTLEYLHAMMWATRVVKADLQEKAKFLLTGEADELAPIRLIQACSEPVQEAMIRGLLCMARSNMETQWMRHTWIDTSAESQVTMGALEYCDYVEKQLKARIGGGSN
jgi:hypothetical protein